MMYRTSVIPLKRKAAWPYVQELFRQPGTTFNCYQLDKVTRQPQEVRGNTAWAEVTGVGGKQRLPSPKASIRAHNKSEALTRFFDLLAQQHRRANGPAGNPRSGQDLDNEIDVIYEEYSDFRQKSSESGDEWAQRLKRMQKRLQEAACPDNNTDYDLEDDPTDRVSKAIRREIELQIEEVPQLGQYLKQVLKDDHGEWSYIGLEKWDLSPPVHESTESSDIAGMPG
jgi:hypothetical protein